MSREQDCIRELYLLLDKITKNAQRGNLILVEKPHGAGSPECAPPIEKMLDAIIDEYGDVIHTAFRAKEVEEWNRRAGEQE